MNKLDQAFSATPRENFVLPDQRELASLDQPLPIGHGQTISQPTTVRLMLEWLDARSGDRVLDVGSGSGWTSALLSHLVGSKGRVAAVELVSELVEFGRANCARLGLKNVIFYQAGESLGWPESAPYDRILVSAAADGVPTELIQQLKIGGKLVVPVHNDIVVLAKLDQNGRIELERHPGFAFVSLID